LLNDFLVETAENIDAAGEQLVLFERDPSDHGAIARIFRLFHTIKGTCGFLGLPRLEHVAHAAENVLGRVRAGELTVTPGIVSLILQSLDSIKGILAVLEATEAEPPGDDAALIAHLNAVAEGTDGEAAGAAPAPAAPAPVEEKPVEAKPAEAKPVEAKSVEAKPVEAKPAAPVKS